MASRQLPRHPYAPRTRGDCVNGPRPCPWVGCKHHLAVGLMRVTERRYALSHEDVEIDPTTMTETCVLDVVDLRPEGSTLREIGDLIGVTRERVRQVATQALDKLRTHAASLGLDEAEIAAMVRRLAKIDDGAETTT